MTVRYKSRLRPCAIFPMPFAYSSVPAFRHYLQVCRDLEDTTIILYLIEALRKHDERSFAFNQIVTWVYIWGLRTRSQ
jgi:hypothetical protein